MSGKVIVLFALVALLVSGAACSPGSSADGEDKQTDILQQLLANREKARDSAGGRPAPRAHLARRAHLSEDEREIMTKQIMQAISEVMHSECMSDRDYQGWLDFGRRDAE